MRHQLHLMLISYAPIIMVWIFSILFTWTAGGWGSFVGLLPVVPVILLMESPYCARGLILLLMVLPLFTVICVTLLSCYLAHNKILITEL